MQLHWVLLVAIVCMVLGKTWAFRPLFHKVAKVQANSVVSYPRSSSKLSMAGAEDLDDSTRQKIENLIKNNKIVLFMKGSKLFPQW